MFRIEVSIRASFPDPEGDRLEKDIRDIGITTAKQVRVSDAYLLEGEQDGAKAAQISRELLADPIAEDFSWSEGGLFRTEGDDVHVIKVAYDPGVTDPVAGSVGMIQWAM